MCGVVDDEWQAHKVELDDDGAVVSIGKLWQLQEHGLGLGWFRGCKALSVFSASAREKSGLEPLINHEISYTSSEVQVEPLIMKCPIANQVVLL